MELVFVHSIWRHGDRSQDGHLKNDPIDPSEWVKGGGGYGQLTPIYIRSTDVNRTINSAFANMLGMFSSGGRPGTDYPELDGWPRGFMPVPIHSTGPASEDCVANAFCDCPRRNVLLEIAHSGEQYQRYIKSENLIHFPETVRNQSWYTDEFYENLDELSRPPKLFVSGIYDPPVVSGINVKKEILKTRGGALINEISARMRTKATCAKNQAKCDNYHRELKYYAYSTHDHTVFALLAVLGIEDVVAGPEKYGEWPDYASDLLVELFQNSTDQKPYIRLLYQPNVNSDFEVVTQKMKGCKGLEYCDLKAFENRAKEFRPDRPMKDWCQVSPVPENKVATWKKDLLHYEDDDPYNSASRRYWYLVTFVMAFGLFR